MYPKNVYLGVYFNLPLNWVVSGEMKFKISFPQLIVDNFLSPSAPFCFPKVVCFRSSSSSFDVSENIHQYLLRLRLIIVN